MDLGIAGRTAIVCGASKGLGRACAEALARDGVELVINARGGEALEAAARAIANETGVRVTPVAADITTEAGRDLVLAACPGPDILVTNAGGPPPGDFHDWGQQDWFDAINANMYTAIDLIRRTIDGMVERAFGRIVNITSSSVKEPIVELGLSNGARAGLTGFVAGLARQHVDRNVTINNLLPGFFDTERGRAVVAKRARAAGLPVADYRQRFLRAGRLGAVDEFGAACAFLCGARAGYITGQNLLIDGGAYGGTL